MLSVVHNMLAMNADRQLSINTKEKAKNTERLSSGYKINRAADDAAGLSISEKMRRQIRGLTQASANSQDGISMVQTADGALEEVHDMLQRLNELSVKSANGTLSEADRDFVQAEVGQLVSEIDRVAETTKFNEIYVLKGGEQKTSYQTALNHARQLISVRDDNDKFAAPIYDEENGTITLHMTQATTDFTVGNGLEQQSWADATTGAQNRDVQVTYRFLSIETKAGAGGVNDMTYSQFCYVSKVENINGYTGSVSAKQAADFLNQKNPLSQPNPYDPQVNYTNYYTDMDELLADAMKMMEETTEGAIKSISWEADPKGYVDGFGTNQPAGAAFLIKLSLFADTGTEKGIPIQAGADSAPDNQIIIPLTCMNATALGVNGLRVDGDDGQRAREAIDTVSKAIARVSSQRSRLGAIQNRLEHTIQNLDNVVENTTAAESQIRDTNMAEEMVEFSKSNLLEQVGQSILAQANQSSQSVLSLLQA